jgi:hypothetical protein
LSPKHRTSQLQCMYKSPEILVMCRLQFGRSGLGSRSCISGISIGASLSFPFFFFLFYERLLRIRLKDHILQTQKTKMKSSNKRLVSEDMWNLDHFVLCHLTLPKDFKMTGNLHNSGEIKWCCFPWSNKWRCFTSLYGGSVLITGWRISFPQNKQDRNKLRWQQLWMGHG